MSPTPLIIGITEVKPKNNRYPVQEAEYQLEGYNLWQVNIENQIGRGIIIYTHKSLIAKQLELTTKYEEAVWVKIQLQKQENLLLGCMYRSESGTLENNNFLNIIIKEACSLNVDHILLMGDYNYKKIDWDSWSAPGETE